MSHYSAYNYIIIILSYNIGIAVRLVGGSSYSEGRVEVNYNGEWGTVCNDGWNDINAGVVCRQMGFGSSGMSIGSSSFGQISGLSLLADVKCNGTETSLVDCEHYGVNITRNCNSLETVGVNCTTAQGVYSQQVKQTLNR